jgi:hypothetical protein
MGSGTTQSGNGASSFELFLFSTQPGLIREAVAAGIAGIIVDWESRGKQSRQESWDTEINADTPRDLEVVRQATSARVICRLNGSGETTPAEIEAAVSRGVDEILLPMVRSTAEVKRVLQMARGRCGVGILVETVAATRIARDLGMLPLSRVYVGLNDLAIDRGLKSIFESVTDGAVERTRENFHVPFGFGGATLPDCGSPVPCQLLLGEMARMKCGFTFLRRSFHRDIRGRDLAFEVPRIHQAIARAFARTPSMQSDDRDAIRRIVASIANGGESANAAGRIADTRA